jgi:hypothetical protein
LQVTASAPESIAVESPLVESLVAESASGLVSPKLESTAGPVSGPPESSKNASGSTMAPSGSSTAPSGRMVEPSGNEAASGSPPPSAHEGSLAGSQLTAPSEPPHAGSHAAVSRIAPNPSQFLPCLITPPGAP